MAPDVKAPDSSNNLDAGCEESYFDGEWVSNAVTTISYLFQDDKSYDTNGRSDMLNKEADETVDRSNEAAGTIDNDEASDDHEEELRALHTPADNPMTNALGSLYSSCRPSQVRSFDSPGMTIGQSISRSFSVLSGDWSGSDNSGSDGTGNENRGPSCENQHSHFALEDFSRQTWTEVLQNSSYHALGAGAAVLTAVIIVHPLTFIAGAAATAGAATAVWAVGVFHSVDKGYQLLSDTNFSQLFWKEGHMAMEEISRGQTSQNDRGDEQSCLSASEAHALEAQNLPDLLDIPEEMDSSEQTASSRLMKPLELSSKLRPSISRVRRIRSAPLKNRLYEGTPGQLLADSDNPQREIPRTPCSSINIFLAKHFPPLQQKIVHEIAFPGLHTSEFFRVFFADDAPYSMKEFQLKRGDVDIVYGNWEAVADIKPDLKGCAVSTLQRILKFNTLTKSYFGPAYAKATKTQRASQFQNLLVIDNRTDMADIPFSDRFHVLERWIIEAYHTSDNAKHQPKYTSKLTVYAQVEMVKSCPWESQIRKKASETVKEVVNGWCKTAIVALKATEDHKSKRLLTDPGALRLPLLTEEGNAPDYNPAAKVTRSLTVQTTNTPGASTADNGSPLERSKLFQTHTRNFQQLECIMNATENIEVMHSIQAGKQSAFAKVLESHSPVGYDLVHENVGFKTPCCDDDFCSSADASDASSEIKEYPIIIRKKSPSFLKRFRKLR